MRERTERWLGGGRGGGGGGGRGGREVRERSGQSKCKRFIQSSLLCLMTSTFSLM